MSNSTIICFRCGQVFKRSCDLNRHLQRKVPCKQIIMPTIQINEQQLKSQVEQISKIPENVTIEYTKSFFTGLFDILRAEGITNMEAFDNIIPFFTLKCIEKYFIPDQNGNCFYTFNYPNDFEINNTQIQMFINQIGPCYKFSELVKYNRDNVSTIIVQLLKVMSQHKYLKSIFPKPEVITIKNSSTLNALLDIFKNLDMEKIPQDMIGDAYENVLSRVYISKDLAQFFTPEWIRKMTVKMLNPQLRDDGTFPTIADIACGTCGFIVSALRYLMKQQTETKKINWTYATNMGIYANDIDNKIIGSGKSNMLITSGYIFNQHYQMDSLRSPITTKFDYIISNPPFGLSSLSWNEINFNMDLKNISQDMLNNISNIKAPFKTKDGDPLFLQIMFNKLNIGGTMSVIFPTGQVFFSRKNQTFIDLRRALIQCGKINYIVKLPKKSFENTAIDSCVFCYTKLREFSDVVNFRTTKTTQKRDFKDNFVNTMEIPFYKVENIPKENEEPIIEHIINADINSFVNKDYSFDVKDYFSNNKQNEFIENENIKVYNFGDICDIGRGKPLTKENFINGEVVYEVYGGGGLIGHHNEYNLDENTITISRVGNAGKVFRRSSKTFLIDSGFYIKDIKKNIIDENYLYYYMKYILENEFIDLQRGTAQKTITPDFIKEKLIRIPDMNLQQEFNKIFKERENKNELLRKEIEKNEDLNKKELYKICGIINEEENQENNEEE